MPTCRSTHLTTIDSTEQDHKRCYISKGPHGSDPGTKAGGEGAGEEGQTRARRELKI